MKREEIEERNLTITSTGRLLDESGNEYRDEEGCCCYLDNEFESAMKALKALEEELDMDNTDGIRKVRKAIKILETIE